MRIGSIVGFINGIVKLAEFLSFKDNIRFRVTVHHVISDAITPRSFAHPFGHESVAGVVV